MSYSGIKNITLKEKYFYFLSTLTSNHRKSKFKSEHLPISNYVQFAQWVKYKDLHGNKQLRSQLLKRSELDLSKNKFTPLEWLFFYILCFFGADLEQFSSVLVYLLCSLHNPFHNTSVMNANQTNTLDAKCRKFAPDAPISPKFYKHRGRWCFFTLVFLIPGSSIVNSSLKFCLEPSDGALFGYRGTQTGGAFKLLFNFLLSG